MAPAIGPETSGATETIIIDIANDIGTVAGLYFAACVATANSFEEYSAY